MYSVTHTAVGMAILKTSIAVSPTPELGYAIGIPLAILSHYPVDYLREKGMGRKGEFIYDVVLGFTALICSYFSGYFWLFVLGSMSGNLFDLIDKKMYLAKFYPREYKPTFYFHNQKIGINFTLKQTKLIQIVSFIAIILMLIN